MSEGAPRFVGMKHLMAMSETLRAWVAEHTKHEVWGAIQTGSSRAEGPLWFIATKDQNALAAASDKGRSWEHLPLTAVIEADQRLTKKVFRADGRELFVASRLGSARLERLVELAFLPRAEGLLEAARDHIASGQWRSADDLLQLAESTVTQAERGESIAYLNIEQKILLDRARVFMELGQEGDALVMLAAVSDDRPGDDLLRATAAHHGVSGWLLTLALAHEEAGQPASAARVYARLQAEQPDDVLILSRARALRRAQDFEAALMAYDELISLHSSDEVLLSAEDSDDIAAACIESAEILEQQDRPAEAAKRYLSAIRRSPFQTISYERLFSLKDALGEDPALAVAAEILRLLRPDVARSIDGLPSPMSSAGFASKPLDDETHATTVVHPGERASATLAQKWIGSLTRDERDTRDIERHAERGDRQEVVQLLEEAARMSGIEPPRVYLSHGSAGVEVLGTDDPFLLLGACHLDPDDDRYLSEPELAFTLAAQIEHIRADHVLLTSSEFWRTFGTKSATALLAFVPLGDVVSRVTDGSILKWVKKLGGSSSGPIRSALKIVEERVAKGATGESVQSAYTASLAKLRNTALTEPDEASLVKERLANFARAAQYTADRVGLLFVDDIRAAVWSMVRLSPTLGEHAEAFAEGGFLALMTAASDEPALDELVLRVSELLRFALSAEFAKLREKVT